MKSNVIIDTKEMLSDEGADLCKQRLLEEGTLIFSFKLTIGKTAIAGCDLYTNEAIAGLIPIDESRTDKEFLKHLLPVIDYEGVLGHAVKGRTLNFRSMSNLAIPLPPLAEQQRIVARLDQQMALVDKARRAAEEAIANISSLKARSRGSCCPL